MFQPPQSAQFTVAFGRQSKFILSGDHVNNLVLYSTCYYSVGGATASVSKTPFPPARHHWEKMFQYIEATLSLNDIVMSGSNSYYLSHKDLLEIASCLLSIPHI